MALVECRVNNNLHMFCKLLLCCMVGEPLDQRLQLVISKGQVATIDEWRRTQPDLPSRSEAIRRLIEAGLNPGAPILIRGPKPGPDDDGGDTGSEPSGRSDQTGKPSRSSKPRSKAAPVSKAIRERGAR